MGRKKGIKTFTPETTSDCIFKKEILSTKVDFIVVVAYGNIIQRILFIYLSIMQLIYMHHYYLGGEVLPQCIAQYYLVILKLVFQ